MSIEILNSLKWRYAVKQFNPEKKLNDSQYALVKESLQLAPSSFGLQPWRFLDVADMETRKKIRQHAWNQSQTVDASHLFVFCRPETIGASDVERFISTTASTRQMPLETLGAYKNMMIGFLEKFSEEQKGAWMERQVYGALGVLLTVCAQSQIDACPMEGFERDGVDEVLGLRARGLRSVVLCALGFRAESDKYASLAKVRYSLSETFQQI